MERRDCHGCFLNQKIKPPTKQKDKHQYYQDDNQAPGDTFSRLCGGMQEDGLAQSVSPTKGIYMLHALPADAHCTFFQCSEPDSFCGLANYNSAHQHRQYHRRKGTSFTASPNLSLNPVLPLSNDETQGNLTPA